MVRGPSWSGIACPYLTWRWGQIDSRREPVEHIQTAYSCGSYVPATQRALSSASCIRYLVDNVIDGSLRVADKNLRWRLLRAGQGRCQNGPVRPHSSKSLWLCSRLCGWN